MGANPVTGAHGIPVTADIDIGAVCLDEAELIVLPGGMPGTKNLESSDAVRTFVRRAYEKHIPIGAICAAPSILGHMGLLAGKNATCFPGFEDALEGAFVKEDSVVVDGARRGLCGGLWLYAIGTAVWRGNRRPAAPQYAV